MKWFVGVFVTVFCMLLGQSLVTPQQGPQARAGCHSRSNCGYHYEYRYRYRRNCYGYRYRYRYRVKVYDHCVETPVLVGVPVKVPVYSIGYQNQSYPPPPVVVTDPQVRYSLPGQPGQVAHQPDCPAVVAQLQAQISKLTSDLGKLQSDNAASTKMLADCKQALDATKQALEDAQRRPLKAKKKPPVQQDDDDNNDEDNSPPPKKEQPKEDVNSDKEAINYFPNFAAQKGSCVVCHGTTAKQDGKGYVLVVDGRTKSLTLNDVGKISGYLDQDLCPPPGNKKGVDQLTKEEHQKINRSLDLIKEYLQAKGKQPKKEGQK